MKKYIVEFIEWCVKEMEETLNNGRYTSLWQETDIEKIRLLKEINKRIELMNDVWEYTNLISCDFAENTMTFELPKWMRLNGWKYYIEYTW